MFEAFFEEIDACWPQVEQRVRLSVIGCGALLLLTDYQRGTKDGDIFETVDLLEETKARLLALAGPSSEISTPDSRASSYMPSMSSTWW